MIKIELTEPEAKVVAEALNHVWREIYDRETTGNGATIRKVLDRLRVPGV